MMTTLFRPKGARLSLLALAIASAFGSAQAQVAPAFEGSVTGGIGLVSGDRQDRLLFDQYNGLAPGDNAYGILGADYYRRNDDKGTVVQFQASDLGTGNRELGLRWKRQGDWKFSADLRELTRRETATANTGLIGAGTATPTVVPVLPGSGSDLDLKLRRTSLGFAMSKVLGPAWQLDASVTTERKEGSRLWGIGFACPTPVALTCRAGSAAEAGWAVLFTPEPIDADHHQVEARVNFARGPLHLSGGYYGSFYRNQFASMTPSVPGSLFNGVGALVPLSIGFQPILNQSVALPPDNQAHQLDLTGSYAFSPKTLMNFKLAYGRATQHQDFAAGGFTAGPAGVSDLGGKVTTTLAQVGFTSRPLAPLSLSGNVRYEKRDDDTPLALYNVEGPFTYTNRRYPYDSLQAKLQGGWQFSPLYRGTLTGEYRKIDRGVLTPSSAIAGVTALREETDEKILRAEVRRRMTEAVSGAVSVETSRRDGSNWLRDVSGTGVAEATDADLAGVAFTRGIFPSTLADRKRDKLRLSADWQASEALSLQFVAETGKDRFSSPSSYGLRDTSMNSIGVDWNYVLSEKWSVNGYLSRGRQELNQARPDAAILAFDNTATTLGIGVTGRPTGNLEVGGSLGFIEDRSEFAQALDPGAGLGDAALLAATGGLPDIVFSQASLKFFGKYTLNKQSSVRVDLGHQRSRWTDWAWGYNGVPFRYSDGTIVNRNPTQSVTFLAVTYTYRWR